MREGNPAPASQVECIFRAFYLLATQVGLIRDKVIPLWDYFLS